jgi:hypothetical protein
MGQGAWSVEQESFAVNVISPVKTKKDLFTEEGPLLPVQEWVSNV